jgi:hypothetical protein
MRFTTLVCGLAALSPVVAGPLGSHDEAVEFFKSKVPGEVPIVSGEAAAVRTYFYVGGRYVDAVSWSLEDVIVGDWEVC